MRADVLAGRARPDALGAFAFHGMWQGLRVLSSIADPTSLSPSKPPASPEAHTSTLDRQLVRLLADMVLATQLEVHDAH
ncbi:hypothetical protein [Rhizobacter sp. Root1221]|uniref:hypothetical protein n=1 Tax=Rhizobacter sp. Root1221 TaxID=1736433 RepID=UPI0006F8BCE4|nr:hypothetical protein [Rhizobacter sp. Root1221]KQV84553.1 hypothetical protein ASC87_29845 [Rhizobacter sp. Root1221]